ASEHDLAERHCGGRKNCGAEGTGRRRNSIWSRPSSHRAARSRRSRRTKLARQLCSFPGNRLLSTFRVLHESVSAGCAHSIVSGFAGYGTEINSQEVRTAISAVLKNSKLFPELRPTISGEGGDREKRMKTTTTKVQYVRHFVSSICPVRWRTRFSQPDV